MPRLSIIVPFQRDEKALDATLLSILEERSESDELIIVHSGDYLDPYQLGSDEAVVIETEQSLCLAEQLNLAARAACSPIVQVLLPGTIVSRGWAESSLRAFEDAFVHAVCVPISHSGDGVSYGLSSRNLPHRRLASDPTEVGGPALSGSMLRRRTLLRMGGWCDAIPSELIDLEMSLLLQAVELRIAVARDVVLRGSATAWIPATSAYEIGRSNGMIANAYSEIPDSNVVVETLVRQLGQLASGLMNPRLAAERLGWTLGVRDRSLVKRLLERVDLARQSFLESATLPMPASLPEREVALRRAA